jgi:hypothetical protein
MDFQRIEAIIPPISPKGNTEKAEKREKSS